MREGLHPGLISSYRHTAGSKCADQRGPEVAAGGQRNAGQCHDSDRQVEQALKYAERTGGQT